MPSTEVLGKFTVEGGYFPSQPAIGLPNGTFVAGEKIWPVPGGRAESGKDVTQLSATNVAAVVQEIDDMRGYLPSGNLVRYPGGAIFGISDDVSAPVYLDETAAFSLSATANELTVALPNGVGGYDAIPAGLPTPVLTTVTAVAGGTKDMLGVYSVRVARRRSKDEAYSGWSNAVLTAALTAGQRIEVTFPAANVPSMQDQWMVAATRKGTGPDGPWYELPDGVEITEVAVAASGRTLEFEWRDKEIIVLITTDVQAAPLGRFLFLMDGILHLVARGGAAGQPDSRIWPLLRNNPTMTRRISRTITENGHAIVGVKGAEDVAFLMCQQSLQIATPTGLADRPTTCRQRWDFGFVDQHAGVVVEGQFYGWSGRRLARTQAAISKGMSDKSEQMAAAPSSEFTRPVESLLRTFDPANIVLGFDPNRVAVVVFHRNLVAGTTTALPFMHRDGIWAAPWTIQGLVYSADTINERLIISLRISSNYRGHSWDTNSTLVTLPYISFPWCDAGTERFDKQIDYADVTGSASQAGIHIAERGTAKPPVNGAPVGPRIWNLTGTDAVQNTKSLNISNAALFAPYVAFSLPNQFLDEYTVSGKVIPLTR